MSMSAETAAEHRTDPAVVCCRTEAGTTLTADNLEDPGIFPDLVESGLLKLEDNVLTVGQAIGGKLTKTVEALTPLTPDNVEGFGSAEKEGESDTPSSPADSQPATTTLAENGPVSNGVVKIHIGEGKNIDLEIPLIAGAPAMGGAQPCGVPATAMEPEIKDVVKRQLTNLTYRVSKVEIGEKTRFDKGVLTIRESLVAEAVEGNQIVKKLEMDVIYPDARDVYTNAMMDILPIATKLEGKVGEGATYEVAGAVAMLTGIEEGGNQVSDAASSDGIVSDRIVFGRPGCPDDDEIIIRFNVVIKDGLRKERPGPFAAHLVMDHVLQEIRDALKEVPRSEAESERVYQDIKREGRPRVVIIKEIMGQGGMHDNLIMPSEPAGMLGGIPNVDLGNLPVMLTPNEVRDGGIHSLCCITPASKETSRHYYREPLVQLAVADEELDIVGVLFVGSPQANTDKFYVSYRLGRLIEAMNVDGALLTTEGYGNNHVDFCSHIEQIGSLGVAVVAGSFCAVQGQLITGNKYMDALVDFGVSEGGVDSDRLEDNTITKEGAYKMIAMLKNKLMGEPIAKPPRAWDPALMKKNYELVKESHKIGE